MAEQPAEQATVHGLIEIRSTAQGDIITASGTYTDRLEYGASVALKLLNLFFSKIAENEGAGHSYSEKLKAVAPRKPSKKKPPKGGSR